MNVIDAVHVRHLLDYLVGTDRTPDALMRGREAAVSLADQLRTLGQPAPSADQLRERLAVRSPGPAVLLREAALLLRHAAAEVDAHLSGYDPRCVANLVRGLAIRVEEYDRTRRGES